MLVFSQRPHGYKAGLLVLFVGLVCFIVGFSSPYWTVYRVTYTSGTGMTIMDPFFMESMSGYNGLWQTCDTMLGFSREYCDPITHKPGSQGWITAVQALQCVGLIGLIAACVYAVVVNFVQREPNLNNRYLEILVFISGILAFIGSIIYVSESSGNNDLIMSTEGHLPWQMDMFQKREKNVAQNDLAWGFCLNLAGCLIVMLSAVVLCAYGRLVPRQQAPPPSTEPVSFSARGPTL